MRFEGKGRRKNAECRNTQGACQRVRLRVVGYTDAESEGRRKNAETRIGGERGTVCNVPIERSVQGDFARNKAVSALRSATAVQRARENVRQASSIHAPEKSK